MTFAKIKEEAKEILARMEAEKKQVKKDTIKELQ